MPTKVPKDQSPSIVWLIRDELKKGASGLENRFGEFIERVVDAGFHCEFVGTGRGNTPSAQWFEAHVPKETRAVFTCETDGQWIEALIKVVRHDNGTIPLFFVEDTKNQKELFPITTAGVDDFLSAHDSVEEIRTRVGLRARQVLQNHVVENQLKEQSAIISRNESSVKKREEFLGICAHDIRSPLGLIQSSLSLVLKQDEKAAVFPPMHLELLSRAKRQTEHALNLVSDLLDVMAFEQGFKPRYEMMGVHELLQNFYQDYRFQAEQKGVTFHYNNNYKHWKALIDKERVQQLLQNLFVNALKFTEPGKNIFLDVEPFIGRRKSDPPFPMMVISIKDEGKGMPGREMQRIFDRFTQIKDYSRAEGRGLGLTVAKQISTLHDGNIWVESQEGKGSTFFVLFPHVISGTFPEVEGEKHNRILIVEPSLDRREHNFEILMRWGYELKFVDNGVDAITQAFYERSDIIIVTANSKKISESDVLHAIKSDPVGRLVPVFLGLEEKGPTPLDYEAFPFDGFLELPILRKDFERALETAKKKRIQIEQAISANPPPKPVKKAA